MAKVTKIADKLAKIDEQVNVYFYDNAYMVEASGRDQNDDWCNVKLMCKDLSEVQVFLQEAESIPRS